MKGVFDRNDHINFFFFHLLLGVRRGCVCSFSDLRVDDCQKDVSGSGKQESREEVTFQFTVRGRTDKGQAKSREQGEQSKSAVVPFLNVFLLSPQV